MVSKKSANLKFHFRNLHVHILEKTLRLAYRHASQHQSTGGKIKSFLLGQALTNAGKLPPEMISGVLNVHTI